MPWTQRKEGQQPLTNYRVLDMSGPMGVYCGKLLADMGADVVKVEPPGGDPMRRIGPFVHDEPGPERSLYWLQFNTNKRSVTLDVTSPEGRELFLRMARAADVVLESFQPGYLDSLGLGYDALSEVNSGLVYIAITPFGQTGPYKDYKASDLIGFAMGGYMHVTGWPHTQPTRLYGSQAYNTASNHAFVAALMALYNRLNTGQGQYVDVSMQDAVTATTQHVSLHYLYEGVPAVRQGFRQGGNFVVTWKCKDGYATMTYTSPRTWDEFRAFMAEEGMGGDLMDEKYDQGIAVRGEYLPHIEEIMRKWALTHTRREIAEWGQSRHHPFGSVTKPWEVLDNPHLQERGFFVQAEHPEFGATFTYPGAPYKLPRSPWKLRSTAPRVGQHNNEVYQKELGLSDEELALLTSVGAV